MAIRLTILCENTVSRPGQLLGEHGFACLVESHDGNYLFDTGQGMALLHNAREIGRNLERLAGVILSHGHYDHAGGLLPLAQCLGRTLPVHGHPDIFLERYWRSEFELRPIGLPATRQTLEACGCQFQLQRNFTRLTPTIAISGEIPRRNPFELGDSHLVVRNTHGEFQPDPLLDDQSLILQTEQGLIVLLGCAHAGVINILDHALAMTGEHRIYALLGGTHLGPVGEEQFQTTLTALRRFRIAKLGVSHCTGLARATQLQQEFAGRFFFATTGLTLELG